MTESEKRRKALEWVDGLLSEVLKESSLEEMQTALRNFLTGVATVRDMLQEEDRELALFLHKFNLLLFLYDFINADRLDVYVAARYLDDIREAQRMLRGVIEGSVPAARANIEITQILSTHIRGQHRRPSQK